jgi:hypothetical protein
MKKAFLLSTLVVAVVVLVGDLAAP